VSVTMGVCLAWIAHREWVQIILMLSWAALAVLACLTLGFWPMALLFITVPALASLFEREKVLEGTLVASLIAGTIWFAGRQGFLPEPPSWGEGVGFWTQFSAFAGLLAFGLATLFSAASRRVNPSSSRDRTYWRDGVEGGMFEYDATARLVGTNEQGAALFAGSVPSDLADFLSAGHSDRAAFSTLVEKANKTKHAQALRVSHPLSGKDTNYDLRLTPLVSKGWLIHAHDRSDEEAQLESLRRQITMAAQDSTDKTIHESGQHMLDLIGDVLDLSKVEAGRYELNYDTFDAADVIRSSVKMIRPAADAAEVSLDVNLDLDQALLIQADRRAVRQILLNLLSNSVKFSDKGGNVEIDAQAIDGDLELSVTDNGAGMSAEELAQIGTPYAQGEAAKLTDKRGSGLGLSLVKTLTELHNGKMDIQSNKGAGTRVKIILPLQAD